MLIIVTIYSSVNKFDVAQGVSSGKSCVLVSTLKVPGIAMSDHVHLNGKTHPPLFK